MEWTSLENGRKNKNFLVKILENNFELRNLYNSMNEDHWTWEKPKECHHLGYLKV